MSKNSELLIGYAVSDSHRKSWASLHDKGRSQATISYKKPRDQDTPDITGVHPHITSIHKIQE